MKWIRTYPPGDRASTSWPGRSYVVDATMAPVAMNQDYRPVLAQLDDDTVIVEWDMAVSAEQRVLFGARCASEPFLARVAPYQCYPSSTGLHEPVWVHRVLDAAGQARWVNPGDRSCHLFGLGMTYLPRALAQLVLGSTEGPLTDYTISEALYVRTRVNVPIEWDIRPVHLHYDAGDIARLIPGQ